MQLLANLVIVSILFGYTIPARYHSYNEMVAELDSLLLIYPNIALKCTIGFSQTESLPIWAMKISDNPTQEEDEPRVLFTGIHHGAELMGCEIALYLINHLLENYGTNSLTKQIVDSTEIWVVPIVNPDGQKVVFAGLDSTWRKNTRDNNNNGIFDLSFDGVDLNRNYNFLFDSGGSSNPSSRTYRGPRPFSEAETKAMAELAGRKNFLFEICYHSDMDSARGERVYYPWRWGNTYSPDFAFIKPIAESIARRTINDLGNGTYTPVLGLVDGGLFRNYLYHNFGTFAYTVEVSTCYIPPENRVDSICARSLPAIYYILSRISGPAITGQVFDSLNGRPLRAWVKIVGIDTSYPIMIPRSSDSSFGRFRRIVHPGNYTIAVTKPGYGNKQIKVSVNDVLVEVAVFLTPTAWTQVQSMPLLVSNRAVGCGAKLVTVDDSLIFALKGNNTRDFYLYNVNNNFWCLIDSVPYAPAKKKRVKQGAALCYDQKQYLYLTKGNNTLEFWRYNLHANKNEPAWTQLPSVPGEKRVKSGGGIAYVPGETNDYIYLLKGSGTKEFYRFRLPNGPWEELPSALGEKGFKKGSGIAFDQESLIYCLKGGTRTNEFYVYSIWDSTWRKLASLPLKGRNGRNERVGDGGALTFASGKLYALKGGNSLEFWEFTPKANPVDTGHWTEMEPLPLMPSGKRVKGGGALTPAKGYIYALKGAKTLEFWVWCDWHKPKTSALLSRYLEKAYRQLESPATILKPKNESLKLVSNQKTLKRLDIYNPLGRKILRLSLFPTDSDEISLQALPAGVYFIRLTTDHLSLETKKIVIIK